MDDTVVASLAAFSATSSSRPHGHHREGKEASHRDIVWPRQVSHSRRNTGTSKSRMIAPPAELSCEQVFPYLPGRSSEVQSYAAVSPKHCGSC